MQTFKCSMKPIKNQERSLNKKIANLFYCIGMRPTALQMKHHHIRLQPNKRTCEKDVHLMRDSNAKTVEPELLQHWIRSIWNLMYWTATSTPDGNGQMMLEK